MASQDRFDDPGNYFHHASAFGIAGQIERPIRQTIPVQASVSLPPIGGESNQRVGKYELPGVLSLNAASVSVGGSFDDTHRCHTTYACSVIEGLNIGDMITVDKVVSRLSSYYPSGPTESAQPNFSILGSYFENLRIAGRKIDIGLTSHPFNNTTYDDIRGGAADAYREWAIGYHFARHLDAKGKITEAKLACALEHNACAVSEAGNRFRQWETRTSQYSGSYRYSAVNPVDLEKAVRDSGMISFGGAICVPRFGVIYLAELLIERNHRYLTMFRVQMGSPQAGVISACGTAVASLSGDDTTEQRG